TSWHAAGCGLDLSSGVSFRVGDEKRHVVLFGSLTAIVVSRHGQANAGTPELQLILIRYQSIFRIHVIK
ncbi:MAG: hypothetical protein ACK5RN_01420, partial [bacterium]